MYSCTQSHTDIENRVYYCNIQRAKLVHEQSARQALCDKSITVHGGVERATSTAEPLIHTHPLAASLSLLQYRCILFIYPDTVAQFSPNEGN